MAGAAVGSADGGRTTNITYTAKGLGFEVVLTSDELGALTARAEGRDGPCEVSGNPVLAANLALVGSVTAYATNEQAYRRSRSAEKRKSHRKAVKKHSGEAVAIAGLIERATDEVAEGWCSGCFDFTTHQQVRGSRRPRARFLCRSCGTPTTRCPVPRCKHFAVVEAADLVTLAYCAQHSHEIPAFHKLGARFTTIDEYEQWLDFESRNAARITRVTGGTLGAAVVVAPAAFFAAPVVGAALGSTALGGGLTGAAATSHGLAMLGGGSLAAGGLGMAGGTAVVTATGGALGGVLGATATTAYVGMDRSFRIERLRSGTGPAVLLASGFLSENKSGWGAWRPVIDERYPESPVYRVHWGAKELKSLGILAGSSTATTGVRMVLAELGKRGSRSFGRLPAVGAVFAARDIAANPWTVAKTRAGMTGGILADLIARTDGQEFILVGHSLGARVMVTAAQSLGTRDEAPRIRTLHLFGAAVGKNGDWRTLSEAVAGTVWNYHSRNDDVLRRVYSAAELGQRAVGREGFRSAFANIKDRNVSRTVAGHSKYYSGVSLETTE